MEIQTEVLICGAGSAGLTAALACARQGVETMLIEKAGFAGGIITAVGLPYFDGIADSRTRRIVVRGIPLELLVRSGICSSTAVSLPVHAPTIANIEAFKLLADRLLQAEATHLRTLFHAVACDVETRGDRIRAVRLACKEGLVTVLPKVVVDCTGDGDIAFWSGAPVVKTSPLQPMTLHFRIGNVREHAGLRAAAQTQAVAAHNEGELQYFYGPGILFLFARNEAYVHAVRVPGDASDSFDLTRAEMQGRADAWTLFERWKKYVPGFENSYFVSSGPSIGVRETRRIVGQHVLTEDDIRQRRVFEDAIATGCWYLDIHPHEATPGSVHKAPSYQPAPYDIPYRSLLPQRIANLLVAGRCHSASQLAASSTRVTVTAMAMGQAAGIAAAMAVQGKRMPAELMGEEVRQVLHGLGAGPFSAK